MTVVGITGRKYHGKDTAAALFVARGYVQLRFADPLKAMLRAFYRTVGLADCDIDRRIEGDLKETPCPYLCGKTPRYAMQTLGVEWGRDRIGRSLWVDTLAARAKAHDKVVISDIRYENECKTVREMGGLVVKIDANGRVPINEHGGHSSETTVDDLPADVIVDNNGTLFMFERAIAALCDKVEQPPSFGGDGCVKASNCEVDKTVNRDSA